MDNLFKIFRGLRPLGPHQGHSPWTPLGGCAPQTPCSRGAVARSAPLRGTSLALVYLKSITGASHRLPPLGFFGVDGPG